MAEPAGKSGNLWWVALLLGAGGTFYGGRLLTDAPKPETGSVKEASVGGTAEGQKILVDDPGIVALADTFPEVIYERFRAAVELSWPKPKDDDKKSCVVQLCPPNDPPMENREVALRQLLADRLKGSSVTALIATVPDPDLTPYGQYADATLEALQRAAETAGLELLRVILPWQLERDPKRARPLQPRFGGRPGILLFRGYAKDHTQVFLLTYVVAESPIFGVDRLAMVRARQALGKLMPQAPLVVVGPTFSGSLQSIGEVIQGARLPSLFATSATDGTALHSLHGVDWVASVQDDLTAAGLALEFLQRRKLYPVSLLTLTEANTSFGQSFTHKWLAEEPSVIQFPMHIARLREAYQNDPDLRSFGAVQARMPKSHLDAQNTHAKEPLDSMPVFQPMIAAQIQEKVLDKIATDVGTQKPDYVAITATDTLDSMFLASFLRSRFPSSRQINFDADLLFTTQVGGVSYDGLISVSKYPLLLGLQNSPKTPFASRQAQSAWAAMLSAIHRVFAGQRVVMSADVPNPLVAPSPLWLSVVGRGAYWPLAKIEPAGQSEPDQKRLFLRLPKAWRLLQLAVVAIWLSLILVRRGKVAAASLPVWMRVRLRKRYGRLGDSVCALLALFGTLSAAFTALAMGESPNPWLMMGDATMVLMIAGLVAIEVSNRGMIRDLYVRRGALLAVLAMGGALYWQWKFDSSHELLFFVYRSTHMESGVSPFLLLLFLATPVAFCTLLHVVRGRYHLIYMPRLPQVPARDELLRGQKEIIIAIEKLFRRLWDWPLKLAALVAGALAFFTAPFNTLEGTAFDVLAALLFHGTVLLATWNFLFFWQLWLRLNDLLSMLELHPMRHAFDRIHGDTWADIWKSTGPHRVRQLIVKTVDRLRTVNVVKGFDERQTSYAKLIAICAQLLHDSGRPSEIRALRSAERELKLACDLLSTQILVPGWRLGQLDRREDENPWPDLDVDSPVKASPLPASFRLAEEVFALRYLALIRYLMAQMRVTTNFVLFAIVCLGLAIISYPLQPVRPLQTAVTVMFVVTGTAVVWVFLQLEVDEILSRLSDTVAGKVNAMFFLRTLAQLGVPLLLVLSTQFPELGRTLFFWVQQALESLK